MVGGVIAIYNTGAWSPAHATAASTHPGGAEVAAALDSARIYGQRAEWPKAEAVLRAVAAQFPMDQEVRVAMAESMVAQKRPADAYEQYEKALAIGPREAKLEFAAGVTASSANLPERALEHFSMAQTVDPTVPAFPLNLGMIQRKLGQTDAAKASLLRAANLDPANAFAWGTLADIALSENNISIALQHVGRARALQPESKEWRLIEARAHKRRNEPEKALTLLLPMELSQRREPAIVRLIAECYAMLGRHSEAAAALGDAADANSSDAALAYDAAVAHERSGDLANAVDFAKRAKMLGSEPAAKLLERLK
jgi:tetratricopeptide (TPR) repeat protein